MKRAANFLPLSSKSCSIVSSKRKERAIRNYYKRERFDGVRQIGREILLILIDNLQLNESSRDLPTTRGN